MGQRTFALLKTRRFLPLFLTQLLGAFNDNVLKNALIILITYQLATSAQSAEAIVAMAGGIFILPFFLFSAVAGQLADKYDKALMVRWVKFPEIIAMAFAALGFYLGNITLLLIALFMMGTQSAFFGPIKYAILPEQLEKNELISGNALLESSTFIAILIGTIIGGIMIVTTHGVALISILGVVIAIIGFVACLFIPRIHLHDSSISVSANILKETWNIISVARQERRVMLPILGISWFWLLGASFLAKFPMLTKDVLHAHAHIVTLFLALFSIGVATGSLISGRVQKGKINATYVPFSLFAISIFIFDLFLATNHLLSQGAIQTIGVATHTAQMGIAEFIKHPQHWRIMFDVFAIPVFGGLFIVPLYAMIQVYAQPSHRSRTIAANNIINSLFMVFSAMIIAGMAALQYSIATVFLVLSIANLFVGIYICKLLPDALIKSFCRWLFKWLYKVEVHGLDNFENASKRALVIANHVSLLDALLLAAFLPEKMMFVINAQWAKRRWIKPFIALVDTFALDPTNPMSTKSLIKALQNDRKCIIFPEGRITVTGALMKVYDGPAMVAEKANADILPVRIDGAQLTPFSRLRGKVRIQWFPKITITVLPARKFTVPKHITGRARRKMASKELYDLMTTLMFESSEYQKTIFHALIDAKKTHGARHQMVEDAMQVRLNYQQLLTKSFVMGQHVAAHSMEHEYVGMLLPTLASSVVTFFGMLSVGRVPALLNYTAGVKQIKLACETAQIKTIYTSENFIANAKLEDIIAELKNDNIKIIYLEQLREEIKAFDKFKGALKAIFPLMATRALRKQLTPDSPAAILFTSGSEGLPKGVVLSHKNLQANRYQLSSKVDFTAKDIVFNALPIFHSFGLTGATLLPLLSGIKTYFYPSPLHYRVVPEVVYDINATIMFGTDTFLAGYARAANAYDFYSVRYVFAGAEKLQPKTRQLWIDQFGVRIFEGYGATETSPVLSTNTPMQNRPDTVGRLLPGITYRLEPVEGIEEGGRLFVAGPNIMLGYLLHDNPGKIIPPIDGWYDTGDIVAFDDDGYITIKGRAKRFAKIAGEMVSLTAVESAIYELWPDHQHAVVSIKDEKKGEQLILVTENKDANKSDIIKHFKKTGIPDLATPKQIKVIDTLFTLGTGKTDYIKTKAFAED